MKVLPFPSFSSTKTEIKQNHIRRYREENTKLDPACWGKKLRPGAALQKEVCLLWREHQQSTIKAAISSPLSACVKQSVSKAAGGRTGRQLKHPNKQEIKPNPGDSGGESQEWGGLSRTERKNGRRWSESNAAPSVAQCDSFNIHL